MLASQGIRLSKIGKHAPINDNLLVLYPKESELRQIEERQHNCNIMCVEWSTEWLDWWRESYDVVEYEVEFS